MRYLKMLGLTAVAAAAMMAFVGAGTASADEICTEGAVSNMCPEGKLISTIEASQVGTGVLETTGGTTLITCNAGDIHLSVTSQGTGVDPITGSVDTLKFTECSNTVNTIAKGSVSGSTSGTNGALTSANAEVTTFILGVTCTYGTGEKGTSLGTTNNTSLTVSTIVKKTAGGFLCPGEARWTASFKITNHNNVDWINN